MTLPTLYKKTKTGAIQQYNVSAHGGVITVEQGQVDGKKQTYLTTCEPKNVGKANETSAERQAQLEAISKHAKKMKSGYVLEPSGVLVVLLPQKVKPYIGNEHKITDNAYSTFKLNGVNATYWLRTDGSLSLTSRGGDEYPAIPHLESEIKHLMKMLDTDCLNGELYIHNTHLQDITSAVKKPKELSKQLLFAVFEAPRVAPTYEERNKKLAMAAIKWFAQDTLGTSSVMFLTGVRVTSKEEIEKHYAMAMKLGYEGTVIYNAEAPYEFNTRSSHVYKYKKVLDSEAKIIDYEVDKNGHPVLHCITITDARFKVKPKGTDAERRLIVQEFDTRYKNKWYRYEYETLSKDGVPLKPVGIGLRKCDAQGQPLE